MAKKRMPAFFECPHCGANVNQGALACAVCGSDRESGWSDGTGDEGIDPDDYELGNENFDYDEYIGREFPEQAERVKRPIGRIVWMVVASLVLLALLLGILSS